MPTTDQLQAQINNLTSRVNNHLAAITVLQQRCTRIEAALKTAQAELAKVKKG